MTTSPLISREEQIQNIATALKALQNLLKEVR